MNPTEALRRYLQALEDRDFTTSWGLLCTASRRGSSMAEYLSVMNRLPDGAMPPCTLEDAQIDGTVARVRVVWMVADLERLRSDMRSGLITAEELVRRMEAGEVARTPRAETYLLHCDEGEWLVERPASRPVEG